jgi:hypothetical protein
MDDKGRFTVTAFCMLVMGIATAVGFIAQQRRLDTLARQVEILERDSVNHGARLDAQTMAEAEAFRRIEEANKFVADPLRPEAARLPGWVDPLPTGEPKAPKRRRLFLGEASKDPRIGPVDNLPLVTPFQYIPPYGPDGNPPPVFQPEKPKPPSPPRTESPAVCPECGLKQYPPPDKEHLRKP